MGYTLSSNTNYEFRVRPHNLHVHVYDVIMKINKQLRHFVSFKLKSIVFFVVKTVSLTQLQPVQSQPIDQVFHKQRHK